MAETSKARRLRLHAEVDAEYSPVAVAAGTIYWLAAKEVFDLWREEKIHVDRYGQRFPRLINIQVPKWTDEDSSQL